MNAAQRGKCFALLRDLADAHNWDSRQKEQFRAKLTQRVTGYAKSWNDFTQDEVDDLVAKLKAGLKPADFKAQLDQQEMPAKRQGLLVHRIASLAYYTVDQGDRGTTYVDGIARRMFGRQFHDLPERALQELEGVVKNHIRRRKFTAARIEQIFREAADYATQMLMITGAEVARQAAKEQAAAITREDDDFDPANPFG